MKAQNGRDLWIVQLTPTKFDQESYLNIQAL